MDFPQRKKLPHDVPLWIDPQQEIYFITINCQKREVSQLALPKIAGSLLESVRFRNENFIWCAHLFLVMPDHIHALISFPPNQSTVKQTVMDWKRWTARQLGIDWQRDFFEHRLRSEENRREKADYILANPVRKNLCEKLEDWPYVFIPDGSNFA